MALPSIAVIIPTLNEAQTLGVLLDDLERFEADEVIVADGGSDDGTVEIASARTTVVSCEANRGTQMNRGAARASSEILLFLHADVRLGDGAFGAIRGAMENRQVTGGNFDIHYQGGDFAAATFTRVNRWRRRFGIFYGDSGIFCRRRVFEELGGYKPFPVLEDYEFARRMKAQGKLALLDVPIRVSGRRWRHSSLLGTLWAWFWIQGLYWCGVSPEKLGKLYRAVR